MRLDSDRSNALFTDARNPLGAGLNNSQNGWYVGAWLDLALSKNAWGMMDGTWAVVKIGLQFNRLIQVIGESVRIPGAWADIDGLRMSSLVALWNRLDCYRQSLAVPDPQAFCRGKVADQFAQHGCESSAARRPVNFSAVPAVSSTQATPPPS